MEAAGSVAPMASVAPGEGRFTRERYWNLVRNGVIGPDDRVELLEGVIVAMAPQNPPHAVVIAALTKWLVHTIGDTANVRVQLPLDLSELSTPEPDLAVVAGKPLDHVAAHPTTALLVIEVADGSLIQDRLTKAPLYAAASVLEYWIVNLRDHCVEVHRQPIPTERRYAEMRVVHPGDMLGLAAFALATIDVAEILPPG